ncbi:MAG: glycosyltransferase family 39 protein [Bacteroidetes bacterium]|nr:glycosyltransferase family 39 protein [Bacteroidota bacterium]
MTLDPYNYNPDTIDYQACAENIYNGNGFSLKPVDDRLAHVPPVYPLFLAVLKVFEINDRIFIALIQIVLSMIPIIILFYFGKNILSDKTILSFSILYILSPHMIYWSVQILTENIAILLFTSSFIFFLVGFLKKEIKYYSYAMILISLSAFTRAVFIYVIPIYIVFLVYGSKKRIQTLVATAVIAIMCLSPWIIRNYYKFNKVVLVTLGTGYIQTYQLANFSEVYNDVIKKRLDSYSKGKEKYLHPVKSIDEYNGDKILTSIAMEMMKAHPRTTVKFFIQNFYRFWSPGFSLFDEKIDYKYFVPTFLFTVFVIPLFLIGIREMLIINKFIFITIVLIIFYFTAVHTFFHGVIRYRAPIEPLIYFTSAFGVDYLIKAINDKLK